jgi:hypothetical protein
MLHATSDDGAYFTLPLCHVYNTISLTTFRPSTLIYSVIVKGIFYNAFYNALWRSSTVHWCILPVRLDTRQSRLQRSIEELHSVLTYTATVPRTQYCSFYSALWRSFTVHWCILPVWLDTRQSRLQRSIKELHSVLTYTATVPRTQYCSFYNVLWRSFTVHWCILPVWLDTRRSRLTRSIWEPHCKLTYAVTVPWIPRLCLL